MESQQSERKRNRLATFSLVCLIISGFCMSRNSEELGILAILGLIGLGFSGILGILALKQIRKSHDKGVNLAQTSVFFGLTPIILMLSMMIMVMFRNSVSLLASLGLLIAYFVWIFKFFRSVSRTK